MQLKVLRGPRVGASFALQQGENLAGRNADNPVHLGSSHVSGRHCVFVLQGQQLTVRDLDSTNGVYVEGHRVREAVLAPGQRVQVGDWLLQLEFTAPAATPQPPAPAARDDAHDRSVTRPSHSGPPPAPAAPPPPAAAPSPAAPSVAGFGTSQPEGSFGSAPSTPAPAAAPSSSGFGAAPASPSGAFGFASPAEPSPAPPQPVAPPPHQGGDVTGELPDPDRPAFDGAARFHEPHEAAQQPLAAKAAPSQATAHPGTDSGGFAFGSGGFAAVGASEPAGSGFGDSVSYGAISPVSEAAEVAPAADDYLGRALQIWRRLRKLPWSIQLAAIMLAASFFLLVAPLGGLVSQVLRVADVAEQQALERGKALSLALAARNVTAIAEQNNLRLEASFLLGEPGVRLTMVTDARGVVRAPAEKVRQSIAGKDYFAEASVRGRTVAWAKGGGQYHILAPIRVAPVDGAPTAIAGWAYLLYDVDSAVADSTPLLARFIAALIVLTLIMGGSGLAIWRLSTAPVAAVREELELCLRGHQSQVNVPTEWRQLRDLTHSINRLLARWKKGDGGAAPQPRPVSRQAIEACVVDMPVPVFLVSAERRVLQVSQAACAWLGVEREGLVGRDLAELLPDAAFLDTLSVSCARVARGEAPSVAHTLQLGANRLTLRAVNAESIGVLAVIAVG